jgi:hypothetical protein
MNRGEVARYLGKSIATVRRAEGQYLHPRRDARGVHQFDSHEVRELRQAAERGAVRLSHIDFGSPRAAPSSCASRRDCRDGAPSDSIASLREELRELYEVSRYAIALLYAVCPRRTILKLEPEVIEAFEKIMDGTETSVAGA